MKKRNNSIRLLMRKYFHEEKMFCTMQPTIKCYSQLPPSLPAASGNSVSICMPSISTHGFSNLFSIIGEQIVSEEKHCSYLMSWHEKI